MRRFVLALALIVAVQASPARAASPKEAGPALAVPAGDLAAALSCPLQFHHPEHDPVLLVHGTNVTASEHWGWNYAEVLPKRGYDTCVVRLPGRERGDIQHTSEYVVAAIRAINDASGRKVDVIGHSQGTLQPRWAMKWWPDIAGRIDDYVSFAGPHHGISSADGLCFGGSCFPSAWQMKQGSAFVTALNRGAELPAGVDATSIYSRNDELVQPWRTAMLKGARNLALQSICPGRPVEHVALAFDAVVFALTVDALEHAGTANVERSGARERCTAFAMPGVTAADIVAGYARLYGNVSLAFVKARDNTDHEPPLRPYTQ